MKYLKVILAVIMIFLLCACSKSEFVNLSAFIDDYCAHTQKSELKFEDFSFNYEGDFTNYFTYIDAGESSVLLTLSADKSLKIVSCKVLISKIDSDGKAKSVTEEERTCFLKVLKATLFSFCRFSDEEADALLNDFSLQDKESYSKLGELTKVQDNFSFSYCSTSVAGEMRITNTFLKEVKPTEKPESKPYFAEVTDIRTETVPLK